MGGAKSLLAHLLVLPHPHKLHHEQILITFQCFQLICQATKRADLHTQWP